MDLSHHSVIVFGRFETGLAIMRSLGEAGVKFLSIDYKKDVGWYSRYGSKSLCPKPVDESSLLDWVSRNFNPDRQRIAFVSNDGFLNFFSRNRDYLAKYFSLEMPSAETLNRIQDKLLQYDLCIELGVPAPKTIEVTVGIDVSNFPFPAFLKGKDVNTWRKYFGGNQKGFVISSKSHFDDFMKHFPLHQVSVILQELIQGPDENHYKYCAYRDGSGKIVAEFMLQKIIQYPVHFGIGASVKSVFNEKLLIEGRKLFHEINYCGVGSAEFKLDERDGVFKLIELNPRYWQQNYLSTTCGINFPSLQYGRFLGNRVCVHSEYRRGVMWRNGLLTLYALTEYFRMGRLDFLSRIKMLRGRTVYSHLDLADIKPWLNHIEYGIVILKLPFILLRLFIRSGRKQ